MTTAAVLDREMASVVRRANAGDQNAMALIYEIGERARKGVNARAKAAYVALQNAIKSNPPQDTEIGMSKPNYKRVPVLSGSYSVFGLLTPQDPEVRKKVLPSGSLKGIRDPNSFTATVVKACGFRHGFHACVLMLANGPVITADDVRQIAASNFGSDLASQTFLYGLKNPYDQSIAPHLDGVGRNCLLVGQCVGRAMRLQALRGPDCPISVYSPVAGWEMGE